MQRTRSRVIETARRLLAEVGPMALNYTLLGERAGVTRQTLYRHWPNQTDLLAELVLTGPEVGCPSPQPDPRAVAIEFLISLRDAIDDPTTAATLMALAAHGDHDASSADALAKIADDRCNALNTLLAASGISVSVVEFARLVGPVFFHRVLARQSISDDAIHDTVDSWLSGLARPSTTPNITRSNIILYCSDWACAVDFYRDVIGLASTHENEWFVEFELHDGCHLSVADAARATIDPSGGLGITLSWQLDDLDAECARLAANGAAVSAPFRRWGSRAALLHDPEGNRIELWEAELS